MEEYHKIETIYERDTKTKKLLIGKYRNHIVEYLKDNRWIFTEKIDGTNIRIYYDGHKIQIAGRTDKSLIPDHLLAYLNYLFINEAMEQVFEQLFGEKEVYLFGEGYGPKIQKDGHKYNNIPSFVVFDIKINGVYLSYEDMTLLCKQLNLDYIPIVLIGTIDDSISKVKMHNFSQLAIRNLKRNEDIAYSEGVVGRPLFELKDKIGKRIIVKIKYNDFRE